MTTSPLAKSPKPPKTAKAKKRNPTIEDFTFPDGLPTAEDLPCSDDMPVDRIYGAIERIGSSLLTWLFTTSPKIRVLMLLLMAC
jgi:hypothetical protein